MKSNNTITLTVERQQCNELVCDESGETTMRGRGQGESGRKRKREHIYLILLKIR